jgi:hypothetical protein
MHILFGDKGASKPHLAASLGIDRSPIARIATAILTTRNYVTISMGRKHQKYQNSH